MENPVGGLVPFVPYQFLPASIAQNSRRLLRNLKTSSPFLPMFFRTFTVLSIFFLLLDDKLYPSPRTNSISIPRKAGSTKWAQTFISNPQKIHGPIRKVNIV